MRARAEISSPAPPFSRARSAPIQSRNLRSHARIFSAHHRIHLRLLRLRMVARSEGSLQSHMERRASDRSRPRRREKNRSRRRRRATFPAHSATILPITAQSRRSATPASAWAATPQIPATRTIPSISASTNPRCRKTPRGSRKWRHRIPHRRRKRMILNQFDPAQNAVFDPHHVVKPLPGMPKTIASRVSHTT